MNFATLAGDSDVASSIVGFNVGGFAEIKISEKFSIQPELLYSTQGAEIDSDGETVDFNLSYLNIPIMAKYYVAPKFSLELGPQASFLLSEKNDFDVNNANTSDFAVDAGLSFKITKNIFVQGRYVLGLTEVSSNAEAKNSVLQFSAGLMF